MTIDHYNVQDEDYEDIDTNTLVPDHMFWAIAYRDELSIGEPNNWWPWKSTVHVNMSLEEVKAMTSCWVYHRVKYETPLTKYTALRKKNSVWTNKHVQYIKHKEGEYARIRDDKRRSNGNGGTATASSEIREQSGAENLKARRRAVYRSITRESEAAERAAD